MSRFTIIFFLLLSSKLGIAQNFHTHELGNSFHHKHAPVKYAGVRNNTNEIQYVFSGLFLFYKFAISSQDNNRCSFHPSCSEYGILAVKKFGAVSGMLATLDRLQRCNGLSPENYKIDLERKLLIDFP
ncbi:MAG: membrane protein insertion efficiency factor YidD [Bacteroidia bacterium]